MCIDAGGTSTLSGAGQVQRRVFLVFQEESMHNVVRVHVRADDCSGVVYRIGGRLPRARGTGNIRIFSILIQKSYCRAASRAVLADNRNRAVRIETVSAGAAWLSFRVVQFGQLLTIENIPVPRSLVLVLAHRHTCVVDSISVGLQRSGYVGFGEREG